MRKDNPKKISPGRIKSWKVICFLALPVLIFWRPSLFFYIYDDWTILIQMAEEQPFANYLVRPDGEQWFPFFHLVYYGLIRLVGERYDILVLINCLGTGVNAFLIYLWVRRYFTERVSLAVGFFAAGAVVNHAIIWNAFYLCYLLCLGFFLGALLLTRAYLGSPSPARLAGIAVGGLLSVLSHNFTLLALLSLPLYAMVPGDQRSWRQSRPLWIVVGVLYLVFSLGYLTFAGYPAATSHNPRIFSGPPAPGYFLHLLSASFLSPFIYLFWGGLPLPIAAGILGALVLAFCLVLIWREGAPPEKRLALWALAFNLLPFILISLTRYQRSLYQPFQPRYAVFTLIGAFLLLGLTWTIQSRRSSWGFWRKVVLGGVLSAVVGGQIFSLPGRQERYVTKSRAAAHCYQALAGQGASAEAIAPEVFKEFCPTAHPRLTPGEVAAVKRFLSDAPLSPASRPGAR